MRISQLTLENFKSFGAKTTIDFAPITLLFGPNSAGKSSLIEALNLFSNIDEYSTEEFNDLFHHIDGSSASSMEVGVTIDLGDEDLIESNAARELNDLLALYEESQKQPFYFDFANITSAIETLGISIKYQRQTDSKVISKFVISANGRPLFEIARPIRFKIENGKPKTVKRNKQVNWLLSKFNLEHQIVNSENLEFLEFFKGVISSGSNHDSDEFPEVELVIEEGVPSNLMTLKVHSANWDLNNCQTKLKSSERIIYENFIKLLVHVPFELLEKQMNSTRRLGPLRVVPKDTFSVEESNDYDGAKAWLYLTMNPLLLKKVNRWLNGKKEEVNGLLSGYEVELHQRGCHTRKKYVHENAPKYLLNEVSNLMIGEGYDQHEIDLVTKKFIEDFNARLLKFLNEKIIKDFDKNKSYAVKFNNVENGHVTGPKNIGVGISQVLPVIVYSIEPASRFIAIEQPELHLHPRVQSPLADLFIDEALESGDAKKTFLIETHSEHLVLRALKRIRHGVLSNQSLSILYVQNIDGISKVKKINLDEEGEFKTRWPHGFFAERREELL